MVVAKLSFSQCHRSATPGRRFQARRSPRRRLPASGGVASRHGEAWTKDWGVDPRALSVWHDPPMVKLSRSKLPLDRSVMIFRRGIRRKDARAKVRNLAAAVDALDDVDPRDVTRARSLFEWLATFNELAEGEGETHRDRGRSVPPQSSPRWVSGLIRSCAGGTTARVAPPCEITPSYRKIGG